jgi:signal transduction histidine kinase
VLNRPFAIKLLAPTVLVSLTLVGACVTAALWLNQVHTNLSKELTENVESTRAAQNLEQITDQLIQLLRKNEGGAQARGSQISALNQQASDGLMAASTLANLEQEDVLVKRIAEGLGAYLARWESRASAPGPAAAEYDAGLARLLESGVLMPCKNLRNYNLDQIELSNQQNQRIVQRITWGLLLVGLGAPITGLVLGYAVARGLHHSIYQLSVSIRDAAGRLNREVGSVTFDELGDLPTLHIQMQTVTREIERVVQQLQQREREILRAEQLAAVGQVAAGVAHELRNPLTSVKMLVQTGLEENQLKGLATDDLLIIEQEIRRMEQCIQMFLNFARPPRSERRQSDLVAVLQRALNLVEGRAKRQRIHVSADFPTWPITANIDPEQIQQVAVNILLNAVDALPRGGTIRLAMRRLHEVGKSNWIEVEVRDTGPGIAPRIRERLFEPFVSGKETGVGLGLSICKGLIEAHGGGIRGENAPEGGAVFSFRLPL